MYVIRLGQNDDASAIAELLKKVTLDLHQKNINQWKYPSPQALYILNPI